MVDNKRRFYNINLGHENEIQEFKESLFQLDKGVKSLTAMLNKHFKGNVYFGVNDKGDVIGLKQVSDKTLRDIRDHIANLVSPQFTYKIYQEFDENNNLYLVLSACGSDVPYSYNNRYYIRNVSRDDILDNFGLRRVLMSNNYDSLKINPSINQNLKFSYLFSYFETNGVHALNDDKFYINYNLK